jgi:DNA-binding response OmpR family regulator
VVEDDPHIRLGVVAALEAEGFEVIECGNGAHALALIEQRTPALVILDVMLPRRSGFDVCRDLRVRKNAVPVLMLTAKGQEIDKVVGLELGADDYVTKPFGVRELIARVQALLRRADPGKRESPVAPDVLAFGDVVVRTRALRGERGGKAFELTPRELAVLALLYREADDAVSRDRILNEIWGVDYYGTTRTLDQVIVKLRQKLEAQPAEPKHLLTVHGLGYRLQI